MRVDFTEEDFKNIENKEVYAEDFDISKLETGDILLFYKPKYWYQKIVEYMTSYDYCHVAIVLKNPSC